MTRIFTEGFEFRDQSMFDAPNTADYSIQPGGFVSPYYLYLNTNYVGSTYIRKSITAVSEIYARVRYYSTQATAKNTPIAFFTSTTMQARLSVDAGGFWVAYMSTVTVLETSTVIFVPSTWYLIEVYYKEADAPNGRFVVYVNGNKIIDFTGDTQPAASTTFDCICFGAQGANGAGWDDIALNDTAGTVDNSWCGDGIVVKITPSGSGTVNNFRNSGSTSGSSNYTYVDEFPSDSDTTNVYVSASSTGDKDQYRLSTFDGAGKTITRIYPEARIRKTRGDSSTIEIGYLPSGGTDQLSGSQTVDIAYGRVVGTSASANPVTGLAWTASDLNLLEYIIKK